MATTIDTIKSVAGNRSTVTGNWDLRMVVVGTNLGGTHQETISLTDQAAETTVVLFTNKQAAEYEMLHPDEV